MIQTNKIIFQQLEAKNHQSNSRFYKSRIKMFHFVVTQGLPCNNYTSIALGSPWSGSTTLDLQPMIMQQLSHLALTVQGLTVGQHTIFYDNALPSHPWRQAIVKSHQWIELIAEIPLVPPHRILQLTTETSYFLFACYSQPLYHSG